MISFNARALDMFVDLFQGPNTRRNQENPRRRSNEPNLQSWHKLQNAKVASWHRKLPILASEMAKCAIFEFLSFFFSFSESFKIVTYF